ncbi:MAG: phenylacetic acid degradation NADH oxidoreductase PaaE [Saprospiraceae bacterium]|nr:MAG: phenylacetic acid degradation NADH oxidoreductase PaaE [Saprospiraceae bacterium]
MNKPFYGLKVLSKIQETEHAFTLTFEVPQDLTDTFAYTQGQHLTLRFNINGEEIRRAYSMCSSPVENHLAVTVKRVEGGKVSNYVADQLNSGDIVDVLPPLGRFFTKLSEENRKNYYLFAAGSGITPIMSILKTILEKEPQSTVFLLYGNRDEENIIFKEELGALGKRYRDQLIVEHILSQPKREKGKGLFGRLSKGTLTWQGKTGRIDKDKVYRFLEDNPASYPDVEYFICGPGSMIEAVELALSGKNIDKKHIHSEHFTANPDDVKDIKGAAGAHVIVQLEGKTIDIEVPEGKTILETLLDNKYDPPYSCTSGSCSTCMAKVTEGEVKMEVCYALDEDEVAEGYVLTCQSHPTSAVVKLTYDV